MDPSRMYSIPEAFHTMHLDGSERRWPTINNLLNNPHRGMDGSNEAAGEHGFQPCDALTHAASPPFCTAASSAPASPAEPLSAAWPTSLASACHALGTPVSHELQAYPFSAGASVRPSPETPAPDALSALQLCFAQHAPGPKPGSLLGASIRAHLEALPVPQWPRPQPPASAHQRAQLHKEKESARRDVQKSLSLCLKLATPAWVLPCTRYRHARNNVEEPANLVTYDRALLHLVALEAVCRALVARGVVAQRDLDQVYADAVPASVDAVRAQLAAAEEYIAVVREGRRGE